MLRSSCLAVKELPEKNNLTFNRFCPGKSFVYHKLPLAQMCIIHIMLCAKGGPVLEIVKRGKRAWRTKDIWEGQKAGGSKNLIAEEAYGTDFSFIY